jgi:hypothetical protein
VGVFIETKIDNAHQETVSWLDDMKNNIEGRPTFEYVDQTITNLFQKFENEIASKLEKKLKEFDYREQISKILKQDNEDGALVKNLKYLNTIID